MIRKTIEFSDKQWNVIEKTAILYFGGSRDNALDKAIELLEGFKPKEAQEPPDGYRHIAELKEGSPDKRCGTCENFSDGCKLGWGWQAVKYKDKTEIETREDFNPILTIGIYKMRESTTFDTSPYCPDWQGKPKEKERVWSCDICGKDIYYRGFYFHLDTHIDLCDKDNFIKGKATPKPDSERWIEI